MANDSITIEGLDKVLRELDRKGPEIKAAAKEGLKTEAMRIIGTATTNLKQNGNWYRGQTAQSGRVEDRGDDGLDVGFWNGYAYFIEFGRRSGRMPPPDVMGEWAYGKLNIFPREKAYGVGWALAKRIAKVGTKPHPFFQPAVNKHKNGLMKAVRDAINKVI